MNIRKLALVAAVTLTALPGAALAETVKIAIGGAAGRRCQIPIEDGKLHEPVEDPQRFVVGDMLLGLRREDVGQQEMGRGVGHGMAFRVSA